MTTVTRLLAAALLILCAGGCATTDSNSNPNQNPNQSSIPWDHPQSWEGQGMLGGFDQGPQGSTGH